MQTLILDSSQISAWFECLQEWANRKLIAINKNKPDETLRPGDAMAIGSLGHKYLEIYYTKIGEGKDRLAAIAEAMQFDPDLEDKADSQFPLDYGLRDKVKRRLADYWTMYAN